MLFFASAYPSLTDLPGEGSRIRTESDLSPEDVSDCSLSDVNDLTGPSSRVHVVAGSVFKKCKRHNRHNHLFFTSECSLTLNFVFLQSQ